MVTTWYFSLHKVQGVQGNYGSNTTVLSGDTLCTFHNCGSNTTVLSGDIHSTIVLPTLLYSVETYTLYILQLCFQHYCTQWRHTHCTFYNCASNTTVLSGDIHTVHSTIVLPTLLYSVETYTLYILQLCFQHYCTQWRHTHCTFYNCASNTTVLSGDIHTVHFTIVLPTLLYSAETYILQLSFQDYWTQRRHTLSTIATLENFPKCISNIFDKSCGSHGKTTFQMLKS